MLTTVEAPPGTATPFPGRFAHKRAVSAIHALAHEETRAHAEATEILSGARRAPTIPAIVAMGTAGSATTLAIIPHTGTVPESDTMSGAVASSARAGTQTISTTRRSTRPARVSPRMRRRERRMSADDGPTTASAASTESAKP